MFKTFTNKDKPTYLAWIIVSLLAWVFIGFNWKVFISNNLSFTENIIFYSATIGFIYTTIKIIKDTIVHWNELKD